jgi:hypothetical protein
MKRLLLTLTFCLTVLAWPALAQDSPTLTDLRISLWPEYDRPGVLVIYRGLFAPDTALPVPVEVRIPAGVGTPTAVAYVDEAGQRLNQAYTIRAEGEELVVAFELSTLAFQLEYYDDLPIDATGGRRYTFTYTADYGITTLNLEIQVPPTAEAFTLDPAADSVVTESDGLDYHLVQTGPVAQGETMSWTFAYQKDDEDLTSPPSSQAAPPATAAPSPQGSDNSTVLLFLVAFLALFGVGATAFWLGRRAQSISESSPPPPSRPKRRGSGQASKTQSQRLPLSDLDATLFCRKCGAQLRADSEFCHKCGTPVRRD